MPSFSRLRSGERTVRSRDEVDSMKLIRCAKINRRNAVLINLLRRAARRNEFESAYDAAGGEQEEGERRRSPLINRRR